MVADHCKETPLTEETNWVIETEHGFSGMTGIHIPEDGVARIGIG